MPRVDSRPVEADPKANRINGCALAAVHPLRKGTAKLLIYFACSRCVAAADSSAEEAVPAAAMKAVAGVSLRTFTVYTISDRGRPLVAQRKAL